MSGRPELVPVLLLPATPDEEPSSVALDVVSSPVEEDELEVEGVTVVDDVGGVIAVVVASVVVPSAGGALSSPQAPSPRAATVMIVAVRWNKRFNGVMASYKGSASAAHPGLTTDAWSATLGGFALYTSGLPRPVGGEFRHAHYAPGAILYAGGTKSSHADSMTLTASSKKGA